MPPSRNVANSRFGDHPAADRRGQFVTATIDRDGNVGEDPGESAGAADHDAYYEAGHQA